MMEEYKMEIIVNNYKNSFNEEYICEECNSILKYNTHDIEIDDSGDKYIICPCCGHKCLLATTENNIEFPKDFYEFGGTNIKSVDVSNDEITDNIKKCIKWLKENPSEPFRYIAYGNMFLCVFNHEDEYYIMVSKNYFDTGIDK